MDYSPHLDIDTDTRMVEFWDGLRQEIANLKMDAHQLKSQDLPLARIKKIMKLDENVQTMMISAEAPVLLAKAAEIFIRELTSRAWLHTERCRRRTLQRIDISSAIYDGSTDQFDFLIDIVPREEAKAATLHYRRPTDESMEFSAPSAQLVHEPSMSMRPPHQAQSSQISAIHSNNSNYLQGLPTNTLIANPTSQIVLNTDKMVTQQLVATNQGTLQVHPQQQQQQQQQQPQQTIQYVLQLPNSNGFSNQPIQIQVISPNNFTMNSNGQLSQGPQLIQLMPQMLTLATNPSTGAPTMVNNHRPTLQQPQQQNVLSASNRQQTVTLQQVVGGQQIVYSSPTIMQQSGGQVPSAQTIVLQSAPIPKQEAVDMNIVGGTPNRQKNTRP